MHSQIALSISLPSPNYILPAVADVPVGQGEGVQFGSLCCPSGSSQICAIYFAGASSWGVRNKEGNRIIIWHRQCPWDPLFFPVLPPIHPSYLPQKLPHSSPCCPCSTHSTHIAGLPLLTDGSGSSHPALLLFAEVHPKWPLVPHGHHDP